MSEVKSFQATACMALIAGAESNDLKLLLLARSTLRKEVIKSTKCVYWSRHKVCRTLFFNFEISINRTSFIRDLLADVIKHD
jgi:hypothetical protein